MKFHAVLLACAAFVSQVSADLPECAKVITSNFEQACQAAGQKANTQAISAARREAKKFMSAQDFVSAKKLTDYAERLEKSKDGANGDAGQADGGQSTAGSFLDGRRWKMRDQGKEYDITIADSVWKWKEYKNLFVEGGGKDVLLLDSNWAIVWVSPTCAAHFPLDPEHCHYGLIMCCSKGVKSKPEAASADKKVYEILENIDSKRCASINHAQAELRKSYAVELRQLMVDCGRNGRLDDAAAIQEHLEKKLPRLSKTPEKKAAKDSGGLPKGTFQEHPGAFSFDIKGRTLLCKDAGGHEMKTKFVRTSPNQEVFIFHRPADNMDIALFRAKGKFYLIYTHDSFEKRGVEGLRELRKR